MARQRICLNCGDNRATEGVLCPDCNEHMMMGGEHVGDGL